MSRKKMFAPSDNPPNPTPHKPHSAEARAKIGAAVKERAKLWRVGRKVPYTLYEGERFVGSVRDAADALRIAAAMNAQQGPL